MLTPVDAPPVKRLGSFHDIRQARGSDPRDHQFSSGFRNLKSEPEEVRHTAIIAAPGGGLKVWPFTIADRWRRNTNYCGGFPKHFFAHDQRPTRHPRGAGQKSTRSLPAYRHGPHAEIFFSAARFSSVCAASVSRSREQVQSLVRVPCPLRHTWTAFIFPSALCRRQQKIRREIRGGGGVDRTLST